MRFPLRAKHYQDGILGPRLRTRDWWGQQTEAAVAVAVLNRMLGAGRPNSVRTSTVAA
jgi:hypothetical protein